MSRKRDTNWSKDEITVLLDGIMEITRTRAGDGKKTNSREVFEYAAKKMADKGHTSRAEREKCRTKWKKMKEEFTHAKRAREGDTRYKEAPGIQPFYDRMEEFINGNFDNISPHSTIVRRTSSLSNSRHSPVMRASARIAACTNGTLSNDNNDTSSTITTKTTNHSSDYPSSINTPQSNASPSSRQNSRLSSGSNNTANNNNNALPTSAAGNNSASGTAATSSNITLSTSQHLTNQQQTIPNGGLCNMYPSYTNNASNNNNNNATSNGGCNNNNNVINNNIVANAVKDNNITPTTSNTSVLNHSNESLPTQPTEHADISYRVSSGCRQITIFGDHDVDIKFRGDCVTINKIDTDYQAMET